MTAIARRTLAALSLLLACAGPALPQGAAPVGDAGVEGEAVPSRLMPDLSDPNSRTGQSLAEPGVSSSIPKALRGSAAKAGGPANDLNPNGEPEGPKAPAPDLARVVAGQALYHGNYCGKGERAPGLEPVDGLDAACRRHDACYEAAGGPSCDCDRVLAREAALVADGLSETLETRRKALSVVEATAAMACVGR